MTFLILFGILAASFAAGVLVFPLVRRLAYKFRLVDMPAKRKIHKRPTPYLGSLMLFVGFAAGIGMYLAIFKTEHYPPNVLLGVGLSMLGILTLGLLDDMFNIPAYWKLLFQILIASIPFVFDIYIDRITNPFGTAFMLPLPIAYGVTVFWLLALMNAMNLIDGLDGLAGGISAIAIAFIMMNAVLTGSNITFPMAALLGGILAFLVFNLPPAKIFMGDSGSLFLGFTIGVLSLISNIKSAFAIPLLLPMVLLLVPIVDTAMAIARRVKEKQHIFGADKKHLHHRLLALGNSPARVLAIMYGATFVLGLFSLLAYLLGNQYTIILLAVLVEHVALVVVLLNLFEKRKDDMLRFKNHIENYSIIVAEEREEKAKLKEALEHAASANMLKRTALAEKDPSHGKTEKRKKRTQRNASLVRKRSGKRSEQASRS